jgi:hypothetical protein
MAQDTRFPNDPVAFAVVPQMASPRAVSDDQDVGIGLLGSLAALAQVTSGKGARPPSRWQETQRA